MPIVRYSPFNDMRRIQRDLDKFWGSSQGYGRVITETAPMDLYEEGNNLVAEVTLPIFTKEEIKVTTDEGVLEVSAEHKEEEEEQDDRRYYVRESSNQYLRRVTLPEGVKADKTEASFKDGVLRVTMPIEQKKELKRVEVK